MLPINIALAYQKPNQEHDLSTINVLADKNTDLEWEINGKENGVLNEAGQ